MSDDRGSDDPGPPPRGALMALVLIAVLVLGCAWLWHDLRGAAAIQDCVMAGRNNCAPVR